MVSVEAMHVFHYIEFMMLIFIYLFNDVVLLMAFSCPIRLAALINARLSLNFDKNCCLNF